MLKDFEKDFDGLDLSDEVKAQLIGAANKRAQGLASKNEELLGKLSSSKNLASDSQGAAEELAVLKALQQQQELESKQHYDAALDLNSEKYTKQINELAEKVNLFETKERDSMINKGINDALTDMRVNPLHQELVSTYFSQKAQLVDGQVTIGDKSLSEAISAWSETDQGKSVRLAPDNSGGDSFGGHKSGSGDESKMTTAEKRAADINKRFNKV